jgi:DNA-binding PadR family transcriptional regulator
MDELTLKALDRWRSRFHTVFLEYFIFKAVSKTPKYGGELVDEARDTISDQIKVPTVYAILKRGVEQELLEIVEDVLDEKAEETRGTARQYYQLTPEGVIFLKEITDSIQSLLDVEFITQKMGDLNL